MRFVDTEALSRHTAGAAPDDRFAAAAHCCDCCQPPRRFDYLHGLKTHQVRVSRSISSTRLWLLEEEAR
jgi:hypothetical protein